MTKCFARRRMINRCLRVVLVAHCTVLLAGCGSKEGSEQPNAPQKPKEAAHAGWTYHGETGPAHWGDLDPAYAAAKDGKEQSPIDIVTAEAKQGTLQALVFSFEKLVELNVLNNGHTVRAHVSEDVASIMVGGKQYKLLQFHFHAPSEHLLDGQDHPIEVHLVHQSAGGELAVMGVFIKEGAEHEQLAKFWNDLPTAGDDGRGEGEHKTVSDFNLYTLIPDDLKSYRYPGSLMTPPCTEAVQWIMLAKPIEMSADQIASFVKLFSGDEFPNGNRRPVQPLNERTVHTDAP